MLKNYRKNCKGFTLLELLVVVLIIGILAGIALPQYQLAVDKSKFATYQSLAKNIADAYIRYMLIQNDAPADIDQLDIGLPSGYTKTSPLYQSCAVFDDMFCCVNYPPGYHQSGSVVCGKKDDSFVFYQKITETNVNINDYKKYCVAKTDDNRAVRLCKNMPYTITMNSNLPTQNGHKTGYTFYRLK